MKLNSIIPKRIMITGGAGFIGSAIIRFLIYKKKCKVLNFDKITYAGNLSSLKNISKNSRYYFVKGDICNQNLVTKTIREFKPDAVMHLAAETHVDRSIDSPKVFIKTNILGTFVLLESAKQYWQSLNSDSKNNFRFHHISTDEVYGSVKGGKLFNEDSAYNPSSPYSASKASSDHLTRAWHRTYYFPIIITNCSNNYGPYQMPDKLIPLVIVNALMNKPLPVYGNGKHYRDWLHVDDHVRALYKVITKGSIGETYNISSGNEKTNIEVVKKICEILDEIKPRLVKSKKNKKKINSYKSLICYVPDRPGHDQRYGIDNSKICKNLNWTSKEPFNVGLRKTVEWYLNNFERYYDIKHYSYCRKNIKKLKKN